jgi:hypothetical protein
MDGPPEHLRTPKVLDEVNEPTRSVPIDADGEVMQRRYDAAEWWVEMARETSRYVSREMPVQLRRVPTDARVLGTLRMLDQFDLGQVHPRLL